MTQSNCNSRPVHPVSYCCVRHDNICPLSPGGWSKFFVPMNIFKPLWNAKRQILVSLLYKWSTEKLNTTQVVFVRARDKPVRHLRACAFKSQAFLSLTVGQCLLSWDLTPGSTQRAWCLARKGEANCGQEGVEGFWGK